MKYIIIIASLGTIATVFLYVANTSIPWWTSTSCTYRTSHTHRASLM